MFFNTLRYLGLIFKDFVQQLVEKLDNDNADPYFLVMDNARIHYNPGLKEWIEDRNKHMLKYLPPYSPFLNPIEECFLKVKNYVKKHPLDNQESLCQRIKEGSYEITKENCEGWIRHSISFFPRCLELEKIL